MSEAKFLNEHAVGMSVYQMIIAIPKGIPFGAHRAITATPNISEMLIVATSRIII